VTAVRAVSELEALEVRGWEALSGPDGAAFYQEPYRALMSSVYARRDGRWRLVLHQQTPIPGSE
jgi:hypothetical protein